jgi:hypothetical protein
MYNNEQEQDYNELLKQINQARNDYISESGKSILFKNKQKQDCAKHVSTLYDTNTLLQMSMYLIPNNPILFIDYTILKLFINEDNFPVLVNHYKNLYDTCYNQFGTIILNLNLDTFSVSAAYRYKNIIEMFSKEFMQTHYSYNLNKLIIYNSPSMMDTIYSIFKHCIDHILMDKIVLVTKKDSTEDIQYLKTFGCK